MTGLRFSKRCMPIIADGPHPELAHQESDDALKCDSTGWNVDSLESSLERVRDVNVRVGAGVGMPMPGHELFMFGTTPRRTRPYVIGVGIRLNLPSVFRFNSVKGVRG